MQKCPAEHGTLPVFLLHRADILMRCFRQLLPIAFAITLSGTIIDRIAVVVNNQIVKDSDIDRDIRLVSFMNGQKIVTDAATRKEAANRLIDQQFIRREITTGEYPRPS